jgi:hypothetical protein
MLGSQKRWFKKGARKPRIEVKNIQTCKDIINITEQERFKKEQSISNID